VGVPDAKLIVLATSVSSFTIADPSDPGMLDVAGLDSAVPRLVSEFVTNKL
jgi:60 kDa SS-A/Ro ribonucleoprotein